MTKVIKNPALFSKTFKVSQVLLDKAGLIDPILNVDTKLFIDPLLLEASENELISSQAFEMLKEGFENIIKLISASKAKTDIAWRSAGKILDLSETSETCLGYGGASIGGSSRPESLKQQILNTAKEIVDLGESDPQIISLMGLFEEGVGPDTISDLTTNLIKSVLAQITEAFCDENKIKTKIFASYRERRLPENPFRPGNPVLLAPKDILRHLPIANDWSEVSRTVLANEEIRSSVNKFVGNIAKATVTEMKHAVRQAALESLTNFRKVFQSLLNSGSHYDQNEDTFGFYAFRQVLAADLSEFAGKIKPPTTNSKPELIRIVREIIENFKKQIEDNNLWEMLWHGNKPRRERASQLLLFAVADAYCKANNIDISPEMNVGGGPVDFKFSTGYENRVLVEVKLSTGTVVHGYQKQLEVYKSASKTDEAIFLVMNVGGIKNKLRNIRAIQAKMQAAGEKTSEIILIEAGKRKSASKR